MLHDLVENGKEEFDYILVLDVSRWGRFQDTDLSAYYTGLCLQHGKQVVFTTIGFPKQDDIFHGLRLSVERYRAAAYSRDLSGKVWKGIARIAADGYWAGALPPYGMQRLLLDEKRNPVRILEDGEQKAIHNQRVVLTPASDERVSVVRDVFDRFVNQGMTPAAIKRNLNKKRVPSPHGAKWSDRMVHLILRDEVYTGTMIWNRSSTKMRSARRANPPCEWIRSEGAFQPVISAEIFQKAQALFQARQKEREERQSKQHLLLALSRLCERYGTASYRLIARSPGVASPKCYERHFKSFDRAYQSLFGPLIEQKKSEVEKMLQQNGIPLERCDDFIVIDNYFSLVLQPALPIPVGYEVYWIFHPDQRMSVDITIGIPLSCPLRCDILGYLAFPKLLFRKRIRVHSNGTNDPSLWACPLVALIQQLRS